MSISNRNNSNSRAKRQTGSDDLESRGRGLIEKSMEQEREKKIDILANSVTAIKNLSKTLGGQLESEEGVRS